MQAEGPGRPPRVLFAHTPKAAGLHLIEYFLAPSHASGSRGYAYYCETGEISPETRARVERSRNAAIHSEIIAER